jgi:hypothetical protein
MPISRSQLSLLSLTILAGCGGSELPPATGGQRSLSAQVVAAASAQQVATDYHPLIQQIYLAYFGRPADPAGLAFFAAQYLAAGAPVDLAGASRAYDTNPAVRALVDAFSSSQESQDLYGGDNAAFVNAIYQNLFGRDADAGGLAFWVKVLDAKLMTRANAAVSIMAGAQQADITVIANKAMFSQLFTAGLVTDDERSRYSGQTANAIVRREMRKVGATTDLAAIRAAIEVTRGGLGILPPVSVGGRIASVREGYILDAPGNDATGFVATATGLYMQVGKGSDSDVIAKLHHGAVGMLNSWSSAEFNYIGSWAVSSVDNDPSNAMGFYWVGKTKSEPNKRSYGLYSANTGVSSSEVEDDIGTAAVAAGGNAGISGPRPWVIANGFGNPNSDNQYVFQQAAKQSAARLTSNLFSTPADKQPRKFNGYVMLSHPSDPTLFVGDGNVLRIYDSESLVESIPLPAEPMVAIHTLLWAENSLWIGYGDKIYRRNKEGQLSLFMTIQSPLGPYGAVLMSGLGGSFCVQGGAVYTVDGTRKNTFTGAVSNWISNGTLSTDQMLQATLLRASLSTIYCHPDVIWSIYSPSTDGKIRVIQPLP